MISIDDIEKEDEDDYFDELEERKEKEIMLITQKDTSHKRIR